MRPFYSGTLRRRLWRDSRDERARRAEVAGIGHKEHGFLERTSPEARRRAGAVNGRAARRRSAARRWLGAP